LTEAPRGTLYHRYELDEEGTVVSADIVTPTAHNVAAVEHDIDALMKKLDPPVVEDEPDPALGVRLEAEKLLRSYDPCFSCATHFVTVKRNLS
jgi:coenzyme F420-reducing hydrogenase alpha subunit